jgi:hypothetical protein
MPRQFSNTTLPLTLLLLLLCTGIFCIWLVSYFEGPVAIFIFAALPITALTALSKSSLGEKVT